MPTNNEPLPFYTGPEVQSLLGMSERAVLRATREGLLFAQRLRQHEGTNEAASRHVNRYPSWYIDAVVRYTEQNSPASTTTEALRAIAYNETAALGVRATTRGFVEELSSRTRKDGTVSNSDALQLLGRTDPSTLSRHRFGYTPKAQALLNEIEWVHTTLTGPQLMNTADAATHMKASRGRLIEAARSGNILGYTLTVASGTLRKVSEFRYPRHILDFEKEYAAKNSIPPLDYPIKPSAQRSRALTQAKRLVAARYNAALATSTNGEDYIPVDRAAIVLGVTERALYGYGLHENGHGIKRADLEEATHWTQQLPVEKPLPPGIFDCSDNPLD